MTNNDPSLNSLYESSPVEYANFGLRLAAILIDGVFIVVLFFTIVAIAIPILANWPSPGGKLSEVAIIGGLLLYFFGIPTCGILYRSFFESSKYQGTPGKIILNIQVVDEDMQRISFLRSVGRNVSKIFSSFLMIGYLIALGDRKCRTLHDQMANTFVIMKPDSV